MYKSAQDKARVWIKNNVDNLINAIHRVEFEEEVGKYADGDKLQWELDSLNFYHSGHPLSKVEYPFSNSYLYELKENDYNGYWNIKGTAVPKINLKTIVGTVLVQNKKNNIVVLSCPEGVIKVKCYKIQFAKYDKVVKDEYDDIIQDSFLKKGTHIAVTGFLRDGMFIPKVYKKMGDLEDPIMKINLNEKGCFAGIEAKI